MGFSNAPKHVFAIHVRGLTFGSNVRVMRLRGFVSSSLQVFAIAGLAGIACSESSDGSDGNPATMGTTTTPGTTDSTGSTTSSSSSANTTSSTTNSSTTSSTTGTTTGVGGATSTETTTGGGTGGTSTTGGGGTGGSDDSCNMGTTKTRLPCRLSETGLFGADMSTLGEGVHPFAPQFALWSDSAEKRRWIWLPPDTQIDTTDMNFWAFPAGTKIWKEFTRDGTRVETRLIEKQQSGTWYTVAYLWRDDQTEADAVPDGMMNASGTEHDVPNADACWSCHSQHPDKALGFSAIQLAHAPVDAGDPNEWTLERLVSANLLTSPPQGTLEFSDGWPEEIRTLFGYLHANCGTCHNPRGGANSQTGLDLWIKVDDLAKSAEESSVYLGVVDVDIMKLDVELEATKRIDPGSLENSALYQRFLNKGQSWSMPPLATEVTDPAGQAMLEAFILGLE